MAQEIEGIKMHYSFGDAERNRKNNFVQNEQNEQS